MCGTPLNEESRKWRECCAAIQRLKAGDIVIHCGERFKLRQRYDKKPRSWLVENLKEGKVYWLEEDNMTPEAVSENRPDQVTPPVFKKMVDPSRMDLPRSVDLFGVEILR